MSAGAYQAPALVAVRTRRGVSPSIFNVEVSSRRGAAEHPVPGRAIYRVRAGSPAAATDSLASALDLSAVVTVVRRNLSRYLQLLIVPVLGIVLVGAVLGVAGLMVWQVIGGQPGVREVAVAAALLGFLTLFTYGQFVLHHLYGQAYGRPA